jgi:hypothetical protein
MSEWSGRVRRITYYRSPYDLHKYRGDKENRYLKEGETQYAVTVETGNGERIWFQSRSNFHKDKLSYWNKKEIRGSDSEQAHNAKYGGKSYHFFPLLNVGDQITVTGDAKSEKGGVKFLKTGAKFKLSDGGSVGVIDTSRGTIIKSELDYLVKKFGIKKIAVNRDFARDGIWQFLSGFQDAYTSKFAASVIKHRMNKLNDRELDLELRARALLDAIIKKRRIHFDAKEHKSLVEKLKNYLKTGSIVDESLLMVNGFLTEGVESDPPSQFVKGGKVKLYHYAKSDAPELLIDPKKFLSGRGSYSRRDFQLSGKARSFWYLNPADREVFFSRANLYSGYVKADKIYNLLKDHLGLKEESKYVASIDFDKLFRLVEEAGYQGVYYKPGFDVVNMFVKVKTKREYPAIIPEWRLTRTPLTLLEVY